MWTIPESSKTCQEWEWPETGPQEHCPAPPGRWKNFLLPLPFKCNSVCVSPPTRSTLSLGALQTFSRPGKRHIFFINFSLIEVPRAREDFFFLPLCLPDVDPSPQSQAALSRELFSSGIKWGWGLVVGMVWRGPGLVLFKEEDLWRDTLISSCRCHSFPWISEHISPTFRMEASSWLCLGVRVGLDY